MTSAARAAGCTANDASRTILGCCVVACRTLKHAPGQARSREIQRVFGARASWREREGKALLYFL